MEENDKIGFPPGVAEKMLAETFRKYQVEHFKKHPPKNAKILTKEE